MLRYDTRKGGEFWGNRECLICSKTEKHSTDCSCDCHFILFYGPLDLYPVSNIENLRVVRGRDEKHLARKLADDKAHNRRQSNFLVDANLPKP